MVGLQGGGSMSLLCSVFGGQNTHPQAPLLGLAPDRGPILPDPVEALQLLEFWFIQVFVVRHNNTWL